MDQSDPIRIVRAAEEDEVRQPAPQAEDDYITVADRAAAMGLRPVFVYKPETDDPISAQSLAARIAQTIVAQPGAALDGEMPWLPDTAAEVILPEVEPGQLDPPPASVADILAFYRSTRAVPAHLRQGPPRADDDYADPQVTVGLYCGGIETHGRALIERDSSITPKDALKTAAMANTLHEIFHAYIDHARQRFSALTGTVSPAPPAGLEEALANAFASTRLPSGFESIAVEIAEQGGLRGYSELAEYLSADKFEAGCLELGRLYFGEQHASVLLDVVREDDASAVAITVIGGRREDGSAQSNGQWSVNSRNYFPPVVQEEETIEDLLAGD